MVNDLDIRYRDYEESYQQNHPPSIEWVAPVIYFDSSPNKNAIRLATSSACPDLFNATTSNSFAIATVSVFLAVWLIGVSMRPLRIR
jgi:hypothetical protein